MDAEGITVMVNNAFLKAYNVSEEGMVLGANALTEPANVKQGVVKYFREALGGKTVETPEIDFISPYDGVRVVTRSRMFPIFDGGNRVTNVVVAEVDITERKKAEEKLARVNVELEGYAHTVSHDLKGPLAAITLGLEMLADSLEGAGTGGVEETFEIVATITRNARNAQVRIEDLLALAEAGQEPGETSSVDIREVVEEVLEEESLAIKEKGIEVDFSGDLGTVTGSPVQIQQVFSNLIGNAIRCNDSEDPVIRISHLGDNEDGAHRYLVRDNGPGIPEDIIDKVFIPFTRGKGGDTGIGLSIVEKIVKVYGGEIKAYNDNGACFEFTLRNF